MLVEKSSQDRIWERIHRAKLGELEKEVRIFGESFSDYSPESSIPPYTFTNGITRRGWDDRAEI